MEPELICVDSSILIEHFRAKDKTKTAFYNLSLKGFHFAFSSIVIYEVLRGKNDDYNNKVFTHPNSRILNFDFGTAEIAAKIYQEHKSRTGKINKDDEPLVDDFLIAASAIQYKIKLTTLNKKHFENIDGLNLY